VPFFIIDHQSCERDECEHFGACRRVLAAANDAVGESMRRAYKEAGVTPPLRGLIPQCQWRDKRRNM
jgi:hypothetical protein